MHTPTKLKRLSVRFAAGFLATVLLTAAGPVEHLSDGVYADHIDWGVIMDLSGPVSPSQAVWAAGLKDYVRLSNENGGVNGRKINVLLEDNRFDAALDRVLFEKLSNQTPVLGISGMGNASSQVALASLIRRGKVPVVGSYTTAKAMTEPPTPMFYGGFCGYREMAAVGVGFLADRRKLGAPKVATVHLDTAGGKEYADYVKEAAIKVGGTAIAIPIKANAADATPQVLEIIKTKPDFIAVHGATTTPILLMRAMKQYGLNIPVFGMAYIGTPIVYNSLTPDTGAGYAFVSCFTPASTDDAAAIRDMATHADQYGHADMKDDVNYVAGWVVGQLITSAIAKVGPDVSREALVSLLNDGFSIDTKGLSAPVSYTKDNHRGLAETKMFGFDYATKRFIAYGTYEESKKYLQ